MRFDDPDHSGVCVTSGDKSEALALVLRRGSAELGRGAVLHLPELTDAGLYRCEAIGPVSPSVERALPASLRDGQLLLSGQVLSAKGLELFLPRPETSLLVHFKSV